MVEINRQQVIGPTGKLGKAGVVKSTSNRTKFRSPVGSWQAGQSQTNTERNRRQAGDRKLREGFQAESRTNRKPNWPGR